MYTLSNAIVVLTSVQKGRLCEVLYGILLIAFLYLLYLGLIEDIDGKIFEKYVFIWIVCIVIVTFITMFVLDTWKV